MAFVARLALARASCEGCPSLEERRFGAGKTCSAASCFELSRRGEARFHEVTDGSECVLAHVAQNASNGCDQIEFDQMA